MENYDEIPKYKKKKPQKSKSANKSDHKHLYEDCLLIDEENHPHKAQYCKICGKINNIIFFETERVDGRFRRMLTDNEVFQKYKDLKQLQIKDIWDKYVSINTEIKKKTDEL